MVTMAVNKTKEFSNNCYKSINIQKSMSTKQEKPKLMVQNVSCIIPETDALGGLYVGNTYGAQNVQILKQYGIRAVLTTSIQTPQSYDPISIPFHLKISAHDKSDYQIIQHLQECLEFIQKCRQVTNVFVHCYAGVSRSVTIVVAYLMKYWGWGLKVALAFVQGKRVVAKPNDGFMEQLKKYEDKLFNSNIHQRPNSALVSTTQYKPPQSQPQPQPQVRPNNLAYTQPYIQLPKSQSYRQSYQEHNSTLNEIRQQFQLTTPLISKKHSQTPIPKILTNNNKNQYERKQIGYSPNSNQYIPQQKHHSNSANHVKMVSMGSFGQYGNNNYSSYYNPNINPVNLVSSNNQSKTKNSIFGNHNVNYTQLNSTSSVSHNKSSKVLIRPKDLPGYKN